MADRLSSMAPTVYLASLTAPNILDVEVVWQNVQDNPKLRKITENLGV